MTPRQARAQIRAAMRRRPELRYREIENRKMYAEIFANREEWQDKQTCPYRGFCYIATQAFCALMPDAVPWKSPDGLHYWAAWPNADGEIFDLTAEQFPASELARIYMSGKPTHFKTLCSRARELLSEATRTTVAA